MTSDRGPRTSWVGGVAVALALVVSFAVSLVAGTLAHLDLPVARRIAARAVNEAFANLPSGKVAVGPIERLTAFRLVVRSVDVGLVGTGHVRVEHLRVRFDPARTVRAALARRNVVALHFAAVESDLVDVALEPGPKPPRSAKQEGATTELRLDVDELRIGHVYVHGGLPSGPFLDVDLDGLRSRGSFDGKEVRGRIATAVTARSIVRQPIQLNVDASATIPLGEPQGERSGSFDLRANASGVRLDAHGTLAADRVDVEVAVPETPPDALRALWEGAPVAEPVSLGAHVIGTLPRLQARVDVTLGHARAHAEASLDLAAGPTAEFTLSTRDVDLRAFGSQYPTSRLGFDAEGRLRRVEAHAHELPIEGWAVLSSVPGVLWGESLPRVEARVEMARTIRARIAVEEPGAPVHLELARAPGGRIQGSLEVAIPSLERVPRLARHGISATGRAVVRAEASLEHGVIASRAILDMYRARFSEVAMGGCHVEAEIEGALRAPMLSTSVHAISLRREPYAVNDLVLRAAGTVGAFDLSLVGRGGTFDGFAVDAKVERASATSIRNLSARIERAGRSVAIKAERASIAPSLLAVEGLAIEGLGAPIEASGSRSKGRVTAAISAPSVDLDRLAVILGVPPERLGGTGSVQTSLDVDRRHQMASLELRLAGGKFGALPPVDAALDVDLDSGSLHGLLSVRNEEVGGLHLETTGQLGGSPFDLPSLALSTGRISVSSDRIRIRRLCAVLPCPDSLKQMASSMRATLQAYASVERGEPTAEGDTHLHLDLEANDRRGRLARAALDSQIDLARVLKARRLPTNALIEGNLSIEPRSFDDVPANWRPVGLSGEVEAHGYVQGTVGKPFLVLEVAGRALRYANTTPQAPALDLEWVTTYDLAQAASDVTVRAASREVARASIQARASFEDLLAGGDRSWTGGAYVELDEFPLAFLPAQVDERMGGTLSGKISVSGIHDRPRVQARLTTSELRVGRDSAGPIVLSLEADEQNCVGSLDVGGVAGEPSQAAARATVRAKAGCRWKNGSVPSVDPKSTVELSIDAVRFPVGTLRRLVDRWVERLRGRVDAHVRATALPVGAVRKWVIGGDLHLREGNMLPLSIGREIKQLELDVTAEPGGVVRIPRVAGEIGSGRFAGVASLELTDRAIAGGHAEFHVPRRQAIPMTIEGVSYGTVWGDASADLRAQGDRLLVDVRAPTLRVELPPQRTAQLESFKDNPAIVVRQQLGPPPPSAVGGGPGDRAERPLRTVIALELGDDVGISREDMKIELTTAPPPGNPKLTFDGEPRLEGAIRILGGRVPVAGRVFQIERGDVRFSGSDPENPTLDIDAVYEGADSSATRINVHVGGTAKDIKLSLTSTPPKPESELLSVLAFGEPASSGGMPSPGAQSTAAGGAGAAAAGVGSAILTTGINQLLSQSILPIRTSLSTGTSTLASASVELTERVRVEYIRVFGASNYGQQQDVNQFALDWRFKPRWLLRTVVGDRGTTTLDVLWNRWY